MPSQVGSIVMASDSATGGTFLSDDQGSRVIQAALLAAGKAADDLRVAQAWDGAGALDLSVLAVTVDVWPSRPGTWCWRPCSPRPGMVSRRTP